MVGREKRGLLVLRWKAGTFAFNQVLYDTVVAAVALQSRPAGAFKELRVRCPLETEKAVAGFVEGLGRTVVFCAKTPRMMSANWRIFARHARYTCPVTAGRSCCSMKEGGQDCRHILRFYMNGYGLRLSLLEVSICLQASSCK